jgi:hypothetical protein
MFTLIFSILSVIAGFLGMALSFSADVSVNMTWYTFPLALILQILFGWRGGYFYSGMFVLTAILDMNAFLFLYGKVDIVW